MPKVLKKKVTKQTTIRELWICNGIASDYIRNDLSFPEVRQAGYIRKSVYQNDILQYREHWYGITSCPREGLPPKTFLDTARKHWEIENGLHHVKDRSWFEDHQFSNDQVLGGILGAIRNISLNVMRTLNPPSRTREKRKCDKSLPKQALSYLMKPLKALMRLARI